MASLPRILVVFLRRFCLTKDHIKRFLRRWTSLLAFLVHKTGEWRFLWLGNPGTIRGPKPPEPSFPSDRAVSSSVLGASVCTDGIGGYVVAASTIPTSVNHPPSRESAQPQSGTAPVTPTLATLPIDPSRALDPSTANQLLGSIHAHPSSGNLSVQSRASDRLSMISASRTSLRALAQTDRPSQDPRATYTQFGRSPGAPQSRPRGRSSRSPSPQPFPNTAQPDNLDIAPAPAHSPARADDVLNPTIGPQGLTGSPPSLSHMQERQGLPAIGRQKQRTTSIGLTVRNPSIESPSAASNNSQEITQEPMPIDTSTNLPLHISPSNGAETASQNSRTASLVLPEGRILQLIVSDQIPRYTKDVTMQVDHRIIGTQFLHVSADLVRENCSLWNA